MVDISLVDISTQDKTFDIAYLSFNIQPNRTISKTDICDDPNSGQIYLECQDYKQKILPILQSGQQDITSYRLNNSNFLISCYPIKLQMNKWHYEKTQEQQRQNEQLEHVMTLCMIYDEKLFLKSLNSQTLITNNSVILFVILMSFNLIIQAFSTWLGYRIADVIMGPLRTLNMKLQEIQADNMKHDLNDDKKSSMEISLLYKSF